MSPLLRHRAFMAMWLAMLVSTSGAYLLLLALSAKAFEATNSATLAGAIFASHWILPLALAPLVTYINRNVRSTRLLVAAELASAGLSVLIGAFGLGSLFALTLPLLLLRGLLEAVTKTARNVALKSLVTPDLLPSATGVFNTSFLLGTGLGALLGSLLMERMTLVQLVGLNVASFCVAAGLYLTLPKLVWTARFDLSEAARSTVFGWRTWFSGWHVLSRHALTDSFIVLLATVALFQSFHNLARTALPLSIFGGDAVAVTYYQICNCLGLVIGAWFVARYLVRKTSWIASERVWLMLTAVAALLPLFAPTLKTSLACYFIFAFAFEVTFTLAQTRIIVTCPTAGIGIVSSFMHPALLAGMLAGVFGLGRVADLGSLRAAGVACAAAGLLTSLALTRSKSELVAEG